MPSSFILIALLVGLIVGAWRLVQGYLRWWESVYREQMKAQKDYFAANPKRHRVQRSRYRYNQYGEVVETTTLEE